MVHAKKGGRGGKELHCVNEVNDAKQNRNSFPVVLKNGMNFMNFMNFRYKSSTYNVNAVKKSMNRHEPFKIKDLQRTWFTWLYCTNLVHVVDLVRTW